MPTTATPTATPTEVEVPASIQSPRRRSPRSNGTAVFPRCRGEGPGNRPPRTSVQRPASHQQFRAPVIEILTALGETSTAAIALFPDLSETRTNVGEHSSAVGERLTSIGELRVDFIPRFTDGVESPTARGETFTDAGQKLIDRGSPFAEVGERMNAVASPPFPGGAQW